MYLTKGGAPTFNRDVWVSECHEKWLPEDYFPIVAQIPRYPRYTNKRIMDPQLKCFVDECGFEIPPEWGLPIPNAEASYKSLAKYGKDLLPMTEQMVHNMNRAWDWTTRHFGLYMHDSKVLTYEEGKAHFDMSTSSGAPFNQLYKTKKDLFEKDPEIDQWLQDDWEVMGEDANWTCLFTNSLKEELRTAEKIVDNSIRTFLSGGVDAVSHGTRLFVDMNEKMYASHLKTASAVGMTPFKGKWNQLYNKLSVFKKGYALDESQYDSSLRAFLMWGCALLRWKMLRKQDQTVANWNRIRVYYRNLVNSLVIGPDGVIIMKKTGNPSGSVNTITDNTLILYTLLAYAWIQNAPTDMCSYEMFEMHTAKALVGDDNTWTVSDVAHEFYNAVSVIAQWKEIGITTTTDSLAPRRPEELDFLSARTVFLNGMAVPIYSRVKLMNSLLYAPREHLTPAITLERVAAMLTVGWTDLPFRRFCREVIDWLMYKYDNVLADEPRWILAKCAVQEDARYYKLFTGEIEVFRPQGFLSGELVKLTQPDKNRMQRATRRKTAAVIVRKAKQPARRKVKQQVVVVRTPSAAPKRQRRRRRNNNRTGRVISPTGMGRTKTGMRSRRSCPVEEDEFIMKIDGSVNYAVTQLAINPGQAATFPWLSLQAKQWEKYRFEYLEFYYKRRVSEFATNGNTGKIVLGIDFDASDPPPTSIQQIEDSDPRVDGMPCENLRLPLTGGQLHALLPQLFVRPGGLPGSADIKTYDAGSLNIATEGNANTTNIGEIRVRYKVIFSVPVLEATTSAPVNRSVGLWYTPSATQATLVTNVSTPLLLATEVANGIGAVNTAGSFVLPAGNYLFDFVGEIDYDGSSTTTQWTIKKNGTSINVQVPSWTYTAASVTRAAGSVTSFATSNGSDLFTFEMVATFTTGDAIPEGHARIVAI